jgi:fructose-1,6-bisphosphatase/inositol monophosphatase family enzyme
MFSTAQERSVFTRISNCCRMTRYGGDCYSYGLLALGHIDLVIDNGLKIFDILPLIPILEAAGAVVTDIHGMPALGGGFVVAAATRELNRRAIALVQDEFTTS